MQRCRRSATRSRLVLDVGQLREKIVAPSLHGVGLWSLAAERLVIGTAIQESNLTYLRQIKGPALGLWQVEPATHRDLWKNWLWHRPLFVGLIRQTAMVDIPNGNTPDDELLVFNLRYAAIVCRLLYRRIPAALPDADDWPGLAAYWKKSYNSHLGAGKPEQFLAAVKRAGLMSA